VDVFENICIENDDKKDNDEVAVYNSQGVKMSSVLFE